MLKRKSKSGAFFYLPLIQKLISRIEKEEDKWVIVWFAEASQAYFEFTKWLMIHKGKTTKSGLKDYHFPNGGKISVMIGKPLFSKSKDFSFYPFLNDEDKGIKDLELWLKRSPKIISLM